MEKLTIADFMDKNWEEPSKSPVLQSIATLCNKTTSWVISCILLGKDQKEQISRFVKFIKIANQLHKQRNYNSCSSILGGLANAAISRLKRFQTIPDKFQSKHTKLAELYSPCDGYGSYRTLLKGKTYIPLIGVYLRDLTLMYDGNNTYTDKENGVINFDKMKLVASRVLEINAIEITNYITELQVNTKLKQLITDVCVLSTDDLYEKSLKIEPLRCSKTPEQQIEELELQNKKKQEKLDEILLKLNELDESVNSLQVKLEPKLKTSSKNDLQAIKQKLVELIEFCE